MKEGIRAAVGQALGAEPAQTRPLAGGDVNEAYLAELTDGRRVFVKANAAAPAGMFEAEAHGLTWLAEAEALRVPEVLAVGRGEEPAFLVLEYLEPAARSRGFDERLGRGLAGLHRTGAPGFGLELDNFIGPLPQCNSASDSWVEFYREHRLAPQVSRAARARRLDSGTVAQLETLMLRLDELVGPEEAPQRLHGDLWSGNLLVADDGAPCLIDPAVYGGHREIDLAMMRLFGGFGARVFAAYEEIYPTAAGADERVALYQLYPLLVHVNLFGGGYADSVARIAARYL